MKAVSSARNVTKVAKFVLGDTHKFRPSGACLCLQRTANFADIRFGNWIERAEFQRFAELLRTWVMFFLYKASPLTYKSQRLAQDSAVKHGPGPGWRCQNLKLDTFLHKNRNDLVIHQDSIEPRIQVALQ